MAQYVLPELDYDYSALEPAISGEINELHHSKHHATYVKGANTTIEQIAEARDKGDFSSIVGLETTLAFNLAGHSLHLVWWKVLSPDGGDKPTGELAAAIDQDFGSFDKFRAQMEAVSTTIQGNGWGVLAWDPVGQRLITQQLRDHHSNLSIATTPLLVFDIWEHAYYLQYKNVKADYVKQLWNVVNWDEVARRFDASDVVVAEDPAEGETLMRARRLVGDANERQGSLLIDDVCVPRRRLVDLVEGVHDIAEEHGVRIQCAGHAGDGNMHPVVVFDGDDADETARAERAFDAIMELGLALGGTITGEHGVGHLKSRWLGRELDPTALSVQRTIKDALDPHGVLNPDRVLPERG